MPGGIALRHELNDRLMQLGHIGYGIRPSARRCGLATWALGRQVRRQAQMALLDLVFDGDPHHLPASELATTPGCPRSTAREAVRALVTTRVLDVRRGDGTYVTSLRPELLLEEIGFAVDLMRDESLLELWEIRMLLEPAATAKAADRISEDRLAELAGILDRMRQSANDEGGLVSHDARFHELVA